ncbi:MAG TPA: nitroreductase family deazaflavin-dependent oxidoreductase [Actinomycetota bacterium]|nr:nitroreductase family deazaflavin-dependent oxidoreductase [Actinomycetota bacterium]
MPLPGWLARLNRYAANPLLRPMAGRVPGFGVVIHRGRTTGGLYRTPVNAFPHRDGFLIALTYGRDVDWVKNVIAAGGCQLIQRGQTADLVEPRILRLGDQAYGIPSGIRIFLRVLAVSEALELRTKPVSGPASGSAL